ncbi:hypothetical protein Lepto7375DRAFT_0821 [Leptolyngbya sp. PCC 7375]|nr:hypothetical protein Lepto7375DRAFT_0821 [Leptolyngbya sp. PCC 7375]
MGINNFSNSNRTIHVSQNVINSHFVTGDNNAVNITLQQDSLSQTKAVDIQAEIKALQIILASFNDPITISVAQKLATEASNPKPDKSMIAAILETGLVYLENLSGFTEAIDKLRPHVEAVSGWLGNHGYKLLPLVGLTL